MNQTERDFGQLLQAGKVLRVVEVFAFELKTLDLGWHCTYTPDFMVNLPSCPYTHVYEVKGAHEWEDSRIKWKWAAEKYPEYVWFWVQRKGRGQKWVVTPYGEHETPSVVELIDLVADRNGVKIGERRRIGG